MVVRAYAVCIGVTPECRRTESEMIGDGQGCVDKADEAYHDSMLEGSFHLVLHLRHSLGKVICGLYSGALV